MNVVYLDNNATTQVAPEVFKAMEPYFYTYFGNPSSLHQFGSNVRKKIEYAREVIALRLGCSPEEIFFTSSGSEGNNLCIKGLAYANRNQGKHIITTAIEHASILNTCAYLEKEGFRVTYLEVDKEGFVSPESLKAAICPETILISIGHVNNEIGTIQPLQKLVEVSQGIPFHTDAVQSFLKTKIDISSLGIQLATFSGHKFHAPKGIGFIYKSKALPLIPQIHGGHQEQSLRSGTENVPYIIGLKASIEDFDESHNRKMLQLQECLMAELKQINGIHINGPTDLQKRVCSNINFSYESLEGNLILQELSTFGLCVSTGSACQSKHSRISHVLKAIGCPARFIHGNIRIGLSKYSTQNEIDFFLETFLRVIHQESPFRLYA